MADPQRIRLSRKVRFSLQAVSLALNGLPVTNVARPTRYGNPYVIIEGRRGRRQRFSVAKGGVIIATPLTYQQAAEMAVALYERDIIPTLDLTPLRGRNLACWCGPDQPCHADILIKAAKEATNEPSPD